MPRFHSDAEKRRILDYLILNGGDIALTTQESGVSASTLYRWLRDENSRKKADSHSYHSYHPAPAPPLHAMERGLGGEDQAHSDPLDPFIPAMIDEAQFLLDSIREAVADAPLNQRVAALVQIIDRIERMRFRRAFRPFSPSGEAEQIVYEFEVEGHVEKEDDLDEIPSDQAEDQTPDAPPEPAYRPEE